MTLQTCRIEESNWKPYRGRGQEPRPVSLPLLQKPRLGPGVWDNLGGYGPTLHTLGRKLSAARKYASAVRTEDAKLHMLKMFTKSGASLRAAWSAVQRKADIVAAVYATTLLLGANVTIEQQDVALRMLSRLEVRGFATGMAAMGNAIARWRRRESA